MRSRVFKALAALLLVDVFSAEPSWPVPSGHVAEVNAGLVARRAPRSAPRAEALSADDALVKAQPICIGSSFDSAGELGKTVLYRARREGDTLHVGYFVYWSTERPWGDNEHTRRVLPALAIDAFYSHFLFVFPGVQRVLYGPADIEGALVRYRIADGRLVAEGALADDESHGKVRLNQSDLLAPDGRVIFLTEAWSHQLGARDAVRRAKAADLTCFSGAKLAPLPDAVAEDFRLGDASAPRRARPAWRASLD